MKPPAFIRPVSFALDATRERFLFADAFITDDAVNGRQLVLVSTFYPDLLFDFAQVAVTIDGVRLIRFDEVGRDEHEPMRAIIYPVGHLPERSAHELEVRYGKKSFTARLTPEHVGAEPTFALATLFKDDFENVETCYTQYKRQGVERFYLFYNGEIPRLRKPLFSAPDIVYGEWSFPYWVNVKESPTNPLGTEAVAGRRHHAQTMFLTMVRFRFLAHCSYLTLVDLDEFLMVRDQSGTTVREHVESVGAESVTARCHWSEVRNPHNKALREIQAQLTEPRKEITSRMRAVMHTPHVTPADLAHVWANPKDEGDSRMKTIYRGDYPGLFGVHRPKRPATTRVSEELALYHLVNTPHGRHNLMMHDAAPVSLVPTPR